MTDAQRRKWNAMAKKPDDRFALPMCSECHRKQHDHKQGEKGFWRERRINPLDLADWLWICSGDAERAEEMIYSQALRYHQ